MVKWLPFFRILIPGAFEEVMLVRSDAEIADFMHQYGITEKVEKIY